MSNTRSYPRSFTAGAPNGVGAPCRRHGKEGPGWPVGNEILPLVVYPDAEVEIRQIGSDHEGSLERLEPGPIGWSHSEIGFGLLAPPRRDAPQ